MSTIASPRSSSIPPGYRNHLSTPTTSARPSIDTIRSASTSPSRNPLPRRNRAALREYYNLKKDDQIAEDASSILSADTESSLIYDSDVLESEMDRLDFDASAYVASSLQTLCLADLLKSYNSLLGDIRALDAEKKALVYDNYNKLIAATETIMKMRMNMDPLNPMASTLDPAIGRIYERADAVRLELGASVSESKQKEAEMTVDERAVLMRRRKAVDRVRAVVRVPQKLRELIAEGHEDEARERWDETMKTLEKWKESGKGGEDVQWCIDDGEAALRGEAPSEKSWSKMKTVPILT